MPATKFSEKELDDLLLKLKSEFGYDFTEYAEASLRRRISSYMTKRKLGSLDEIKEYLEGSETNTQELIEEISVTVTEMFRDPLFFKSIRENVIKRLATYPFIKIWVAGCATGEEVYSIAIILQEEGLLQRSLIYATDINQNSLKIAAEGIYPMSSMKMFTESYQKAGGKKSFSEYYNAKYESVIFNKSLRENIVFASHNLVSDKSFNEFQMILCRNVLIYFNQDLQNKVLNLFYDSLCRFGVLALGNKESLLFTDKSDCFDVIDKHEKIYMKVK